MIWAFFFVFDPGSSLFDPGLVSFVVDPGLFLIEFDPGSVSVSAFFEPDKCIVFVALDLASFFFIRAPVSYFVLIRSLFLILV